MNNSKKLEAPFGYTITRGRATSNENKRRVGLEPIQPYTVTPTRRSSTGVAPPYTVVSYAPPVNRWNKKNLPYNVGVLNHRVPNAYGTPTTTLIPVPKNNDAPKGLFNTLKSKISGIFGTKGGKRRAGRNRNTRRNRRRSRR